MQRALIYHFDTLLRSALYFRDWVIEAFVAPGPISFGGIMFSVETGLCFDWTYTLSREGVLRCLKEEMVTPVMVFDNLGYATNCFNGFDCAR